MFASALCLLSPTIRQATAFGVRNSRPSSSSLPFSSIGRSSGLTKKNILGGGLDNNNNNSNNRLILPTMTTLSASISTETTTASSKSSPVRPYDEENKETGLGSYTPSEFESKIYRWWESSGCFDPDAKPSSDDKQPYVLPMPPPNVTGRLHMGHAIFVALQDILARFHRMRGRPVLWLPGMYNTRRR
jgi:hypothetical protein